MIERLRHYDVQVMFILNPLNWSLSISKYEHINVSELSVGPIHVTVYYG